MPLMNLIWKNQTGFPPLLNEIRDSPAKLFYLGQKPNPQDKYFAIVGTRHPTQYGKQMAEEFSAAIARAGFVVVSGLAYGIDAIAHKTALDCGAKTVAVLGSGFDYMGPVENLKLAKKIQEHGTILTEYEADIRPTKFTFPQRNRIIAGMSVATLVIEAPERSGALITGRLAVEYNRDAFALPGNVTQENSRGTNKLIQKGCAYPVSSPADIFEFFGMTGAEEPGGKSIDAPVLLLNAKEKLIYEMLKSSPRSIDEMVEATKLPASEISSALSLLELKGLAAVIGSQAFIAR